MYWAWPLKDPTNVTGIVQAGFTALAPFHPQLPSYLCSSYTNLNSSPDLPISKTYSLTYIQHAHFQRNR